MSWGAAPYIKWATAGNIKTYKAVQSWITLTGQFFPHNLLIIEYLEKEYPQHIKELISKLESEQTPEKPIL